MKDILKEAELMQEELAAFMRTLHQMPEIGMELPKTTAYIKEKLEEWEVPFQEYLGGNAMVATIGGGISERCIALRTDMDALAIAEETGLSYGSANGNMHACGHDANMAMMLGAIKLLKRREKELDRTVKVFFQPNEEGMEGARQMIEAGVLEEHPSDAFLALHLAQDERYESGQFMFMAGAMMASADIFDIRLEGEGVHAAHPETGKDPVTAAAQLIQAVQSMACREFSALDSVVVSICNMRTRLNDGDDNRVVYNALPKYVDMAGTIRCLSEDVRKRVIRRMEELTEATGRMFGIRSTFQASPKAPVAVNHAGLTGSLEKVCRGLFGDSAVIMQEEPFMGSEDAACFMERIPSAYVHLVSNVYQNGRVVPGHHPRYRVDESVLYRGAALLAGGALGWKER